MNSRLLLLSCLLLSIRPSFADGPADNRVDTVRRVPPPGVKISDADRAELEVGTARLGQEIAWLRADLKPGSAGMDLLPDVQIYHKAVQWALAYDEFFKSNEVASARTLLKQGLERAQLLRAGQAPWVTATGLVVRGYASKIDGSVQPYGLVVPPSFRPDAPQPYRLDFWLHGRGETLSELSFISDRQRSPGEFVPPNAFVMHLYGRYCNGNRLAGEMDLFEALAHARKYYSFDDNRMVVRGFSLGGAACWHLAVHHAGLWAAAAPGAGFSETADFLRVFQKESLQPAWWEQKLWRLHDSTDHAINLFNCPTVAYSGEIDSQKQAADLMVQACAKEGMQLTHIIGPKTGHSYHPEAKKEVNRRIDAIAARGRDPLPRQIRFVTHSLRYNEMKWLTVDGLEHHWEPGRVEAEMVDATHVHLKTEGVTAFTLSMPSGLCPLDATRPPTVHCDGQDLTAPVPETDRSWTAHFHKDGGRWVVGAVAANAGTLHKEHGLQGPIDDAFLSSFLMVRPTGAPAQEKVGAWVASEMAHATNHWRQQYRGDARVKDDTAVTDGDIAAHNLILWGDPTSNRVLARLADKLPVHWGVENISVGDKQYPAGHHAAVLIYPNPLNPARYIVLNSGFTFREYDYLNNARQTPKLPDWAVVDVDQPVTPRAPGGIANAGFFDEEWKYQPR